MSIIEALQGIDLDIKSAMDKATAISDFNELKDTYFGKNGKIAAVMKDIRHATNEEKPLIGKTVNDLKSKYLLTLDQKIKGLEDMAKNQRLLDESIDISLPANRPQLGAMHPIRKAEMELVSICQSMGFSVATGPLIEDMFHNFEALNIPESHPARDMHDTFYIDESHVLRTHTSSVQIRYMKDHQPPIKIIAPGQVFRSDQDRTHSPMFHQLEGLYMNANVSLPELKYTLETILKTFFNDSFPIRYRSSYFPFTEPSFEVDVQFESTGEWMEVLGAGMVHRNVCRSVGFDPDQVNGFAFGLGIDRLAMLKYSIADIRSFYENDIRFLRQGSAC